MAQGKDSRTFGRIGYADRALLAAMRATHRAAAIAGVSAHARDDPLRKSQIDNPRNAIHQQWSLPPLLPNDLLFALPIRVKFKRVDAKTVSASVGWPRSRPPRFYRVSVLFKWRAIWARTIEKAI